MFEAAPLVVEAPPDVSVLADAADIAAARWHLPAPELIRIGANGVFGCGDVILRVGVTTAPMDVALAFADRLAALGVRAGVPARRDWIDLPGHLAVTAWQRIDFDPDGVVDWEQVGEMVATVHAIDPTTVDHPLPFGGDFPWWDFDALLGDAVSDLQRTNRDLLVAAYERHRWWDAAARHQPLVLCHGDVHPGNVLVTADGPTLIDWDLLCVGPPEWDHAALATWTDRWGGDAGVYAAFRAGVGELVDPAMLEALAELRLLAATLMRIRRGRSDPDADGEAVRRLAYWRGDPDAPQWRAQ
ncbi:MAG: hypothetical protein JWM34_4701 [Ilumatobacteraceae bacterium]|nr:hypothetical protein [Ilumatobacteraceae bacterium]